MQARQGAAGLTAALRYVEHKYSTYVTYPSEVMDGLQGKRHDQPELQTQIAVVTQECIA